MERGHGIGQFVDVRETDAFEKGLVAEIDRRIPHVVGEGIQNIFKSIAKVFAQELVVFRAAIFGKVVRLEQEAATGVGEMPNQLRHKTILAELYNKDALSIIHQTIVMLEISIELKTAIDAEDRNDLKTSLKHYKVVAKLILSTKAARDKNLIAIEQYVQSKIKKQA